MIHILNSRDRILRRFYEIFDKRILRDIRKIFL